MEVIKLNRTLESILKYIFLTLSFFSVFKGIFSWVFNTSIFEYFDEIIFGISVLILFTTLLFSRKLKIIHFLILVFFIYSVFISVFFGFNDNFFKIVLQSLITIKFFVILLVFIDLFKDDFSKLKKFFFFVIKFAVIGIIIHLTLGSTFNDIVGVSKFARPDIRYVGFFTHPNHLAYLMVVYVALILNRIKTKLRTIQISEWIKIIMASFIIVLTDSRTAILVVGILFLVFYWEYIKRNYKLLLSFLIVGLISIILLLVYTDMYHSVLKNINATLDITSTYIRGNMIFLAGLITYQFFPIGTGAASFGSVLANEKVYELYGQADRYYFANEIGIYDSNIASIVGEYGLIGIILFITMFVYLKKHLLSFTTSKNSLVGVFIFIFIFYSITNPMLTNNLYALISSIVLILLIAPDEKTLIQK